MIRLDDYDWVPIDGAPGGHHQRTVTKLLLHSTEGSSIAGAVGAYRARRVPPHVTFDPARSATLGRCVGAQHIGLDRSAEALWHVDDDGVIQVELVGFARETPGWSDEMLTAIARWVVVPIVEAVSTIPLRTTVTWERYPASYGRWPGRLSFADWDAYAGILGHMHAPARAHTSDTNLHGDPGGLNVPRILDHARDILAPTPEATPMEIIKSPAGAATMVIGSGALPVSMTGDDIPGWAAKGVPVIEAKTQDGFNNLAAAAQGGIDYGVLATEIAKRLPAGPGVNVEKIARAVVDEHQRRLRAGA